MALAALGSLTDELITAVAKIAPERKESPRVQSIKRRVEAALRPGTHGRINQFEVARQLEGLQEKFQVLNRDELAAALRSRLAELQDYPNAWHPEILSLLVELSDRPAQLSNIDRLATPLVANQAPEQPLSWADLDAHGAAYSDEEIWEEVDFGPSSSDDELTSVISEISLTRRRPRTPSVPEQDYVIPDEVFVSGEDEDLIIAIEKAQFWKPENKPSIPRRKEEASCPVTELQLARETIFMLQGLPTSIFWRLDNQIEVDRSYTLAHSSQTALLSLLKFFTETGSKIDALRRFTEAPQSIAYMQTFCRGIEDRLREFDGLLSKIQCSYLSAGSMVSLLQLNDDVRQWSHQLLLLSNLVSKVDQNSANQPMRCLDLLYNLVYMTEALGDEETSRALAILFFSCFKTYTRSIELWMESGQVDPLDAAFFVKRKSENGDLRTLWHDWYEIDEGYQTQNIPQFLEPSLLKVFTTGKSIVFLRHLNALPDRSESATKADTIFDNVYSESTSTALPFSALVESTFDRLVDLNHSASAGLLRTALDEQCGLWVSFDALQHVYLGQDLSILGMIDAKIFELMDRGRSWDDKFLLTEVTRSAFSAMPSMDVSRLVVRSDGSSSRDSLSLARTVKILETISIDYVLPWPVANIVTQDAIQIYQRASTFLMQIRRAKYALVKQRLRDGRAAADDREGALVHSLHHNLLWFLDTLYAHLTYLVISTANQSLHQTLSIAEDVDAMITAHNSYVSSLEKQCLISENLSPIHDAIINLLDLSIHFADLQTVHAAEEGMFDQGDASMLDTLRRKKSVDRDSDSDSDSDNDFEHEQTLTISFRDSPYDLQMRNVKRHFDHMISFVADGLKGVARADGLPSWNILAERLEWRNG
ncbi:putative gamma-tubulin complex component GCP5 [Penicillium brasilianum]|uniref:Spindle pole body component n=1 Tax=Penicillium brasilianum TaxID=104259 RepID=A0A1S9RUR6_PENBI|nr:putative gamma-tubulin complex component GCP5 [Penicillium brasilianum]